jgi:hypothetical protein
VHFTKSITLPCDTYTDQWLTSQVTTDSKVSEEEGRPSIGYSFLTRGSNLSFAILGPWKRPTFGYSLSASYHALCFTILVLKAPGETKCSCYRIPYSSNQNTAASLQISSPICSSSFTSTTHATCTHTQLVHSTTTNSTHICFLYVNTNPQSCLTICQSRSCLEHEFTRTIE